MFTRVINFFSDTKTEFLKLSWPSKKQAIRLTFIVFIVSTIMAIFFGVIDYILNFLLQLILTPN